MARADALAASLGQPGERLMQRAGEAVAGALRRRWTRRPVLVLCGPGNNGGDGYVIARALDQAGWPVRVAALTEPRGGDALTWRRRWTGPVEPLDPSGLDGAALVVDALFGAGLTRPLDGVSRAIVERLAERRIPTVAVDVPSGLDGDSGRVRGAAAPADLTVTFFRLKPGHLLHPGRALCGTLVVADIGLPSAVLAEIASRAWINDQRLWSSFLPWPATDSHKYRRGHAVVRGGGRMTGAARLAALAARRIGTGLVTIAAPAESVAIYAADRPGTLVEAVAADDFGAALQDPRRNAVLVGPGNGQGEATRLATAAALAFAGAVVLDADALAGRPEALGRSRGSPPVLTPHEGEFARVFGPIGEEGRLGAARAAARRSSAVVVLKGPDTVVAGPDGRAAISARAPAELATAGSGDVLAGLILGLLAQGMPSFEAASAAVWIHGRAGARGGPGLIAEDLPEALPAVLGSLRETTAPWAIDGVETL
ncbi:MAG: NAD(P)H-hydrate dehydratase [Alphaproteobacteria bacterium]|nr:NAD(P)H-hydrate dehydratase [Alphaproteobacteria bacterium]